MHQRSIRTLSPVFAFVFALTLGGLQPAAEERVNVRVGKHDGYARLVFDWATPIGYRARVEDGRLVLEFERAAVFDLSRLADLSGYLEPPERELSGERLSIALRKDWPLSHFPLEAKVVIDLLGDGLPDEAAAGGQGAATATPVETSSAVPAVTEKKVEKAVARISSKLASAEDAPSEAGGPLQLLAPELLQAIESRDVPGAPAPAVESATPSEAAESKAADSDASESGTPAQAVQAAAPRGSTPQIIIDRIVERAGELAEPGTVTLAVTRLETEDPQFAATGLTTPYFEPARLRFDWNQEVPLAAFQRGQEVWLAFRATAPQGVVEQLKALVPELVSAKRLDPPEATVFRLEVPPLIEARITASGDDWLIDLRHQPRPLSAQLEAKPAGQGAQSHLQVMLEAAEAPILLDDLERGGQVALVASARPGQAVGQQRRFPGITLLSSLQGVAVQLDDPATRVRSSEQGVAIRRPGGLLSLPAAESRPPLGTAEEEPPQRLFDLAVWRRGTDGTFEAAERALQSQIIASDEGARLVARVELAKLYFSHGFTDEALGVLQLLEDEHQRALLDPELLLLTAAAHILRGDHEKGARLLGHPALIGEAEARLWEGLLAAEREDWPLAAYRFDETNSLIEDYLPPVRTRLFLRAAEAAAAVGDRGEAMRLIRRSEEEELSSLEEAEHDYVLGRVLLADHDEKGAQELLERVAGGRHGYASVKARLALIDLGLENQSLSVDEAIAQLEQLRFAWRGDAFEFALLRRIADLNESVGRYRETLRVLRSAAAHFPHLPEHEAIGERMNALFRDLFIGGRAKELPPLTALSLYEEFRELSPAGEEGSRLVGYLADRLVEVDLLGRATELLEEQITFRLSGLEKARIGARLALIYLLDRRPREALAALERSAAEVELPLGLDRQRRFLEAHAYLELDRGFESLALIEDDASPEAERLRIDILWELREWGAAAELIERGLPEPTYNAALDQTTSGDVLSLAVALTLGNQTDRLARVQDAWGAAMARGPHAESFALLSGDLTAEQVGSVARELAKVKQAQAFMSNYRETFGALGEADESL